MNTRDDAAELQKIQDAVKKSHNAYMSKIGLLKLSDDDRKLLQAINNRVSRFINYQLGKGETLSGISNIFVSSITEQSFREFSLDELNPAVKEQAITLLSSIRSTVAPYAANDNPEKIMTEAKQSTAPQIPASSAKRVDVNLDKLLSESDAFADFRCPMTLEICSHNDAVRIKAKGKQFYTRSALQEWVQQNHTDPLTREHINVSDLIADGNGFRTTLAKAIEDELRKLGMGEPQIKETLEQYKKDNKWPKQTSPELPRSPAPQPSPGPETKHTDTPSSASGFFSTIASFFGSIGREKKEEERRPHNDSQLAQANSTPFSFDAIVVGEPGVGKTNLIRRLAGVPYTEYFIINPPETTTILLENQATMQLYDQKRADPFRRARSPLHDKNLIFIAFNIADRRSFERVEMWISEIDRYAPEDRQIILVGTGLDGAAARQVRSWEGEKLAHDFNTTYFEVSSKTDENIKRLIEFCNRIIVPSLRERQAESASPRR